MMMSETGSAADITESMSRLAAFRSIGLGAMARAGRFDMEAPLAG
jgi:hypothetical protein